MHPYQRALHPGDEEVQVFPSGFFYSLSGSGQAGQANNIDLWETQNYYQVFLLQERPRSYPDFYMRAHEKNRN